MPLSACVIHTVALRLLYAGRIPTIIFSRPVPLLHLSIFLLGFPPTSLSQFPTSMRTPHSSTFCALDSPSLSTPPHGCTMTAPLVLPEPPHSNPSGPFLPPRELRDAPLRLLPAFRPLQPCPPTRQTMASKKRSVPHEDDSSVTPHKRLQSPELSERHDSIESFTQSQETTGAMNTTFHSIHAGRTDRLTAPSTLQNPPRPATSSVGALFPSSSSSSPSQSAPQPRQPLDLEERSDALLDSDDDYEPIMTEEDAPLFTETPERPHPTATGDDAVNTGLRLFPTANSAVRAGYVNFQNLPDPENINYNIASLTTRFSFPGTFYESRDRNSAKGSFLAAIKRQRRDQWGPNGPPIVTFPPPAGRRHFVDITWKDLNEFKQSHYVKLAFKNDTLTFHSKGPAIPSNHLVIKMTNIPVEGDSAIWGHHLQDLLSQQQELDIISIWAVQVEWPSLGIEPEFAREILAHVAFKSPPDIFPFDLVQKLPGYCRIGNNEARLRFKGRFDYCFFCGSRAYSQHKSDACPRRVCSHCSNIGHFAANCPDREDQETST